MELKEKITLDMLTKDSVLSLIHIFMAEVNQSATLEAVKQGVDISCSELNLTISIWKDGLLLFMQYLLCFSIMSTDTLSFVSISSVIFSLSSIFHTSVIFISVSYTHLYHCGVCACGNTSFC